MAGEVPTVSKTAHVRRCQVAGPMPMSHQLESSGGPEQTFVSEILYSGVMVKAFLHQPSHILGYTPHVHRPDLTVFCFYQKLRKV